jgi:DNA repair protein RadC
MTNHSIKLWPKSERPQERLWQRGAVTLSDAELLAILLRNGIPGKDAVTLSREVLQRCGGLRGLLSVGQDNLQKVKGLGPAKIAMLLAVFEIAKRQLRENILDKHVLHDPEAVLEYLYASMRDLKKEIFKVIFLDKGNRILDDMDLFEGTIDQTAVHPREVIKAALERHATGIVLVHNHPSGRVQPSQEDRVLTVKLQTTCSAIGIQVLDHLIIGDNQFFSFRAERLL